jgi:mannose-6-phosphate isomerase class I
MSFMYNPYPFDDLSAVNKPVLEKEVADSILSGTNQSAEYLSNIFRDKIKKNPGKNIIVAFEGYITAQWQQMINLIVQQLRLKGISLEVLPFASVYKDSDVLEKELNDYLETDKVKDPALLFGKIFKNGFEGISDKNRLDRLFSQLTELKESYNMSSEGAGQQSESGKVILVYGNGCAIQSLRPFYDLICYFDVTPKESILRIRRGNYINLGDKIARPVKETIRRCYYVDFEMAIHLRGELLKEKAIDYYLVSDEPNKIKLVPQAALYAIFKSLVNYPMRCKPVYLEGVWGGTYVKKLRQLPNGMRNCAWVFDLIPMEVSIVVETGNMNLEFPFFTFVQTEGENLMGADCVRKFKGYFPIRFNYDDSYHSSGNMSIQVHSGHDYNVENFGELGRQDESYYVVVTGHNAKTFVGFKDDIDPQEFIEKAKVSEKKFTPIDYEKYIHSEESKPGMQVMLPAGTIHSSGRNQVVLEIGSLTIGSYTYKLYDYLRADLDGIPRPIHTWHGEKVLCHERTSQWVRKNIVQSPQLVRNGEGWAEYIVGEHDLIYFSLRRLEFSDAIKDNTNGVFHVLALVDGEKVKIQSINHPEYFYIQNFMDIVIVPANMGEYTIHNLGDQPVCIHKTLLKEGFVND